MLYGYRIETHQSVASSGQLPQRAGGNQTCSHYGQLILCTGLKLLVVHSGKQSSLHILFGDGVNPLDEVQHHRERRLPKQNLG